MATALYRRYRSARFGDLIGQAQIAQTLRNQVQRGQLAHAYLFAGIRGTGKTSTARILAKAVNCLASSDGEPCNECEACREIAGGAAVDVLEIDAASNRGIDEIRDLREKVNYLPASVRRKVYIIDEAHMLTTPAWNAFLKTLEEPPEHVVFVLATTEPHGIPDTIRSRVQRFDFRRVSADDIALHLQTIVAAEGATADSDALALVAAAAQGSVRDALSLLDQVLASGPTEVDLAAVRAALGLAEPGIVRGLLEAVANGDAGATLRGTAVALDAGADPRQLLRELSRYVRGVALAGVGYVEGAHLSTEDADFCARLAASGVRPWVSALETLSATERELRQPVDARLQVELCLLRLAQPGGTDGGAGVSAVEARLDRLEKHAAGSATDSDGAPPAPAATYSDQPTAPAGRTTATRTVAVVEPSSPEAAPAPPSATGEAPPPAPTEPSRPPDAITPASAPNADAAPRELAEWTEAWPRLVDAVNRVDSMLAGVLRDCRPLEAGGGRLVVGAPYTFHLERLAEPAKKATLDDAVAEIAGDRQLVEMQFCGDAKPANRRAAGSQSDATRAVLETFKGSRVVSSRIRDDQRDPEPRAR